MSKDTEMKSTTPVIRSDAEATALASGFATRVAAGAARRAREALSQSDEIDAWSQSGLWAVRVPESHGGAALSYVTVAEIIKIVAAADPALGRVPVDHFVAVEHLAACGSEAQKRDLFGAVLNGVRLGYAIAEPDGASGTRLSDDGDNVIVDGTKVVSTGTLLAHVVAVTARDPSGRPCLMFVDHETPGVETVDDASLTGSHATASGQLRLTGVRVPRRRVVPVQPTDERPSGTAAISELLHAAVEAGIARGTIADTVALLRTLAQPGAESGLDRAVTDPFTISAIGDLQIKLHAAEAVLTRAAEMTDIAIDRPDAETVAAAAVAASGARVLTTEIAMLAATKLFELGGMDAMLDGQSLERHWRNARAFTAHDPGRRKLVAVGNYHLSGVKPRSETI